MPKRNDLSKIMIIGAGPIVIAKPASSTIPALRPAGEGGGGGGGLCAKRATKWSW